jgi:hypothetical protein
MTVTRVLKGGVLTSTHDGGESSRAGSRPAPMTGASARRPLPLPPAACILLLAHTEWLLEKEKEKEKHVFLFLPKFPRRGEFKVRRRYQVPRHQQLSRAAFYSGLKSKVGLIAAKTAALRVNMNTDGCLLASHVASHFSPTSHAPSLLISSLSHHVRPPCMY